MSTLAGIFATREDVDVQAIGEDLAITTAQRHGMAPRLLYRDAQFVLYAIERKQHQARSIRFPWQNATQWVFGDINYGSPEFIAAIEKHGAQFGLPPDDTPMRWTAIEYHPGAKRVRIRSDRSGWLPLFLGQRPGSFIFSGDFAAVVKHMPKPIRVDLESCVHELGVGYSPGNRTVFGDINIVPEGSDVTLSADAVTRTLRRSIEFGDGLSGLSDEKKFELLDGVYERVVRRYFSAFSGKHVLSLSGGNDSRYALGLLGKYGEAATCCTFGHPDSAEVAAAHIAAASAGTVTNVFHFPQASWDSWQSMMHQAGNTGVVQWAGWADQWLSTAAYHGEYLITGLGVNAFIGTRIKDHPENATDWIAVMVDAINIGWIESPLLREEVRTNLRERLCESHHESIRERRYAFPHQRMFDADLSGRQRRHTAVQAQMIANYMTHMVFPLDDEIIDFYAQLPIADLRHARIYRAYAASRFPHLFKPVEDQPLVTAQWLQKGVRFVKRLATGSQPRLIQPVDLQRIIDPHREQILELARAVKPMIDEVIDIDAFCAEVQRYGRGITISGHQIVRAVNLFHLLQLADFGAHTGEPTDQVARDGKGDRIAL